MNQKETNNAVLTTEPVQTGNPAEYRREWGRTEDVNQTFGIRRGTLYNLHDMYPDIGKLVRVRGKLTGVRLWNMDKIRQLIESQPDESANEKTPLRDEAGQDELN